MDSNKADVQLKKLLKRSKVPKVKNQEEVLLDQPSQSFKLEWSEKSYSREEIFSEYLNFLKQLPNLITCEKKKILNTVRSKLKIQQIEKNLGSLRFEILSDRCDESNILKELGIHLGYSLRILAPPLVNFDV